MNKKVITIVLITFASSVIWAQSQADGTWDFSMSSPFGALISAKVTMKIEGATLTGEFDMGGGRKWPIEEGTVQGNEIAFKINRDGASMTYVMNATVDGNSIKGSASAMGSVVDWSMSK